MKILGITGGIGSGKSTVTRIFADLGAETADADAIAKKITEPNGAAYEQVVRNFGIGILNSDGTINRKKLAEIVFKDKGKLEVLNDITHRCVSEELNRFALCASARLVCLDVPLLFTCRYPIHCDKTLAVVANTDIRIKRVAMRSGLSKEEILSRMNNQLSDAELEARADYCIANNGMIDDMLPRAKEIYAIMTEL